MPQPGQPLWQAALDGPGRGQPLLCGNKLLLAWGRRLASGGVMAFDSASGTRLWATPPCSGSVEALACQERRVYYAVAGFLGRGARLACLDLADGRELWSCELSGTCYDPPLVEENRLYLASDDGLVHCLEISHGSEVVHWPVLLTKGRLWLRRCAGQIVAISEAGCAWPLDPLSGSRRLQTRWELGSPVTGPPAVSGEMLYFGAGQGNLLALNGRTGQVRLLAQGMKSIVAAPLVEGEALIFGAHDRRLHALDAATGRELWPAADCRHSISTTPAAWQGLVVAGATHGELFAFDLASGQPAWRFSLNSQPFLGHPLFQDGVLYCAAESGAVFALPWHLGNYAWAAGVRQRQGQLVQAAECFALAGDLETVDELVRQENYSQALDCWRRGGRSDLAAYFRESLLGEAPADLARTFESAGKSLYRSQPQVAADLLHRAADWFLEAGDQPASQNCSDMAARAVQAPYISIRPINLPRQWLAGEEQVAVFELKNQGSAAAQDVRLRLAGCLQYRLWLSLEMPLQAGSDLEIEIPLTASCSGDLLVEVKYANLAKQPFSRSKSFPLQVCADNRPTLEITQDVGLLKLEQQWRGKIKVNGSVGHVHVKGEDGPA